MWFLILILGGLGAIAFWRAATNIRRDGGLRGLLWLGAAVYAVIFVVLLATWPS